MNVLYVINGLGTGGAERSLAESLPLLREAGVCLTVVCSKIRKEGVQEQVRDLGCTVRFLDSRSFPNRLRDVREMIKQERYDLVHTTIFDSDILGRLASIRTGVPVLTSLVNTSYDRMRRIDPNVNGRRLWAARMVDGWTARNLTTHFHAITHAVKASAIATLGIAPDRITVIERGRDVRRLGSPSPERRQYVRSRLGISENEELVLAVGRQEYQKGHLALVEAASLLLFSRPNLRILIAGREGNASAAVRREVERRGLQGHVTLLGHREDIPDLHAAADAFAFPSLYEGLGGAVIEAMAMGLPIVASRIPAIEEVVEEGENALLTVPNSPAELAGALARVLDDPVLAAHFGRRSRNLFHERFEIERSVERMVILYGHLRGARVFVGGRRMSWNEPAQDHRVQQTPGL